ncbi:MAG TPA: hypothetical protein VK914_01535 [bacterium]|nr:hypothetical protein [bacterium]
MKDPRLATASAAAIRSLWAAAPGGEGLDGGVLGAWGAWGLATVSGSVDMVRSGVG